MPNRPFIIAEIGFNHEGNFDEAMKLIEAAAHAGADAAKFQTFKAIDIQPPSSQHYAMLKEGALSSRQHEMLKDHCDKVGIEFMSTPFSVEAVELLEKVGVERYKIASMDCTSDFLLKRVASTGKPVIVSTGMASLDEIRHCYSTLHQAGTHDVTLMHCISKYPPVAQELNMKLMLELRREFPCKVGYSDHYPGIDACIMAGALGCEVIETHFTLDNTKNSADHYHSLTPEQLTRLIEILESFAQMRGSTDFNARPDREMAASFRRGVYAKKPIDNVQVISEADVMFTRPASEITPSEFLSHKVKPIDSIPQEGALNRSNITLLTR
jgi:N,N'-diacetyllegionaminate synthase